MFTDFQPDPIGQMLGTFFNRFESRAGIGGLAKVSPDSLTLELLAVHSATPGTGQFRRFIANCKAHYHTICVWHVSNPLLDKVLPRYGFNREVTVDGYGETLTGWRWDKPPQCAPLPQDALPPSTTPPATQTPSHAHAAHGVRAN